MSDALVETSFDLAAVSDARRLIEETDDLNTVREVVAQADGWRAVLRSINESAEKQRICAELKIRAIRRAGQLLEGMREGGKYQVPDGMNVSTACQYRRVGRASDETIERYLTNADEPTFWGLTQFLPKEQRGIYNQPEVRDRVTELVGQGLSKEETGRLLGISGTTVRKTLDPRYAQKATKQGKAARRRQRSKQASAVSRRFKKSGDPLGEVYPLIRQVSEALQVAVDATDDAGERRLREAVFPYVHRLEDALYRVLRGTRPDPPSIPSDKQVQ